MASAPEDRKAVPCLPGCADHFEKRAIGEMKHAEKLIGRVLFLEGIPMVSKLLDMRIGEVPKHQAPRG